MMSNLRTADYAITDNAPNFWIQHKTDGFVCQVVYGEHEKPEVTAANRAKALLNAQKIIRALQRYDYKSMTLRQKITFLFNKYAKRFERKLSYS